MGVSARRGVWGDRVEVSGKSFTALLLVVVVAIPSLAGGQGWWGAPRNRGFDRNTVIRVAGAMSQVHIVPRGGPSTLVLQAGSETFTVVLCPHWYLSELHADLREGDRLIVEGSKMMDAGGNLHLMAARVTNERTGSALELRDESGRPRWLRDPEVPEH
jgi:hypothetical protein